MHEDIPAKPEKPLIRSATYYCQNNVVACTSDKKLMRKHITLVFAANKATSWHAYHRQNNAIVFTIDMRNRATLVFAGQGIIENKVNSTKKHKTTL